MNLFEIGFLYNIIGYINNVTIALLWKKNEINIRHIDNRYFFFSKKMNDTIIIKAANDCLIAVNDNNKKSGVKKYIKTAI